MFDVNSAAEKCKDQIGDKWEGFANFWRTTQLEYTWLRSLMKRHKDFWQITEDSLDKSMSVFKIENSMRDELLDLYKILSPFEEVPKVLKSLKEKNFKLAILSNGTPSLLNQLVQSNNLNNLFDERYRDQMVGSTRKGPHRVDFFFKLNNKDARTYASEGQQRGLVLALRLAEFSYLRDGLGRIPILLADDILGELDQLRKSNFRKLLPPEAQVFATGTAYPSENESAIWESFKVSSGKFSPPG
mgnify:CR=1 FL=1